jgi:hypothetical protein
MLILLLIFGGISSNLLFPTKNFFLIYIPILVILYLSIIYQEKYIIGLRTFIDSFPNHSTELRSFCNDYLDGLINGKVVANYVGVLAIVIGMVFIRSIYYVTDIQFNLTFIIGCFALLISTLFSITSYFYYIVNNLLIYSLSKQTMIPKDVEVPKTYLTPWFKELINMTKMLNNGFIIIGCLYSVQYFLVCFIGNSLGEHFEASLNNVYFISSWIIIFTLIALVFIAGLICQNKFISKIYENINYSLIKKLNNRYNKELNKLFNKNQLKPEILVAIDNVVDRLEKPQVNPLNQMDNKLNGLLTIITLMVNISTLYINHFKNMSIPFLSSI